MRDDDVHWKASRLEINATGESQIKTIFKRESVVVIRDYSETKMLTVDGMGAAS